MNQMIYIVDTGVANLASVQAAVTRLGMTPRLTRDARVVKCCQRVILPGVGSFDAGMRSLRAGDLVDALRSRIERDLPTLAICLGMQLLCRESEESPRARGIGVIDGAVMRFRSQRVPQMGWNHISPAQTGFFDPGYAYFANSYRLTAAPDGWETACADYAGPFIAAMRRGNIAACQFHPEISGDFGMALLKKWAALASREVQPC